MNGQRLLVGFLAGFVVILGVFRTAEAASHDVAWTFGNVGSPSYRPDAFEPADAGLGANLGSQDPILTERVHMPGFFSSADASDFDERGLLGLAFHPGFANPDSPGYQKIYTYSSEMVDTFADFTTVALPAGEVFDHQSVVAEWTVDTTNPNAIDKSTRREVMRIDEPQFNHNGGMLAFGRDEYLYIAAGDGGAANDFANGQGDTGKCVFGDFSTSFFAADGRLFYADLGTGLINELKIGADDRDLGLYIKAFGQDADGELYLLAGTNLGPFGTGGVVLKIVDLCKSRIPGDINGDCVVDTADFNIFIDHWMKAPLDKQVQRTVFSPFY
ncbi:MAG: PQQ-dependent sugar dehydrogenase [Phycisphaerales bacterium]|nr:MAG: PQQ-dependent sugar dehydrogenase [Phycisphaerales bacterium]